jgi:thioesterase domain-containing protein
LRDALLEGGVSALWLTVGLFNEYVDDLEAVFGRLRHLLVGGDALDARRMERLLSRATRPEQVWNGYGPTETTTFATTHRIGLEEARRGVIPIGRPIANTRVHILDGWGQAVPVGVKGELHIGGPGVARGYLNQPELTAERFVADPWSAEAGAKLYRTGDLGRWRSDGTIEYLGRNDFQVKIRGFRIELGEIEARLAGCAGVLEAVVLAQAAEGGEKRLVGYVVAQAGARIDSDGLRAELASALPDYMVPSALRVLDALPLTANGKVDRAALPALDACATDMRAYQAPVGWVETEVAAIWGELLGVERVGRNARFFEIGGHSLLAVRMIARVDARWPGSVQVRDLFDHPSLAEFCECIARGATSEVARPAFVAMGGGAASGTLYCIPGAGMLPSAYAALASTLSGRATVKVLEHTRMDGRTAETHSMDEEVRSGVDAILVDDPRGPWRIMGHSYGGAVAFEMARELRALNGEVELILLDSLVYLDEDHRRDAGRRDAGNKVASMEAYWDDQAWNRSDAGIEGREMDLYRTWMRVFEAQLAMLDAYVPRGTFDGPVSILLAADGAIAAHPKARLDRHYARCFGGKVARSIIPGGHLSVLGSGYVAQLAAALLTQTGAADREAV